MPSDGWLSVSSDSNPAGVVYSGVRVGSIWQSIFKFASGANTASSFVFYERGQSVIILSESNNKVDIYFIPVKGAS
jgi:hypothetical protein